MRRRTLGAIQDIRHSGAGAQPASPESKNTDLKNKREDRVHRFRACPQRASRNDTYCG
jgi:hypothetical protein